MRGSSQTPRGASGRLGVLDRVDERLDVVEAAVALAVDEEAGRAGHPGRLDGLAVGRDRRRVPARAQVAGEALGVEAEIAGVPDQVVVLERLAIGEEEVV